MFEVGLLLHFPSLHSPASFYSRGSPDGAMVAPCPGDRRAIREGVPEASATLSFLLPRFEESSIFLDYLASFGQFDVATMFEVGLFLQLSVVPMVVLRAALRTLLGDAEKWVCFCTFLSSLPRILLFAGESGWRDGRSLSWRPSCHSGGGAWNECHALFASAEI